MPKITAEKSAYNKAYGAANKDKIKARRRARNAANPELARTAYKAWYEANKERRSEYNKAYLKVYYADNKEELLQQSKEYRDEHVDECRQRSREYYAAHPESFKERNKAWAIANPLMVRLIGVNGRARRRGCAGAITLEELITKLELTCGYCPACGRQFGEGKSKWSWDHVVPLSKSGAHTVENGQAICWRCNDLKAEGIIRYPLHEREAAPGWKQLLDSERVSADDQTQSVEPAEAGTVSL